MVNLSYARGEDDGVEATLKVMGLSKSLVEFIRVNEKMWINFGKMNSHIYRAQLFEVFEKKKLSDEAKLMVYFFASVIKNKARILKAMNNMPSEAQTNSWFYPVKDFFETETEQYVTKAEKAKKYPVVNIPNTNPGLDIMLWMMFTNEDERTVENMKDRVTFAQINLMADVQTLAKQGYEKYWTETVKGTKNDDKPEEPKMREDYYKNPASDKYNLVNLDLTALYPKNKKEGFGRDELDSYIAKFNQDLTNKLKSSAK
jgi:hypothetical protein